MQALTTSITHYPEISNAKLIYFEGDFDDRAQEVLPTIQKEVDQAPDKGMLIFEFSKLSYLNSFAIGKLIAWHHTMKDKQGELAVVGANENILDVFRVQGIDTIFKIYSTLDALKKG